MGRFLVGVGPHVRCSVAGYSRTIAERYPILCEDLRTVRGKVLVQSGPERVGLKGVNGPYTPPTTPQKTKKINPKTDKRSPTKAALPAKEMEDVAAPASAADVGTAAASDRAGWIPVAYGETCGIGHPALICSRLVWKSPGPLKGSLCGAPFVSFRG